MERILDGRRIHSALEFHREIGELLDMGPYYGRNLDALWDRLSTDVERPITLVWKNADDSRRALGPEFDRIVGVLDRVKRQDAAWNLEERFDYRLE
jgi:ribonuclease inhibitor